MTLSDILNAPFARDRPAKAKPSTKLVAIMRGHELPVEKRGGLWTLQWGHMTLKNSRLGDLIAQIEAHGGTVQRRPL